MHEDIIQNENNTNKAHNMCNTMHGDSKSQHALLKVKGKNRMGRRPYIYNNHVQYESKKTSRFRSVFIPVSTVPFTSVLTVYRGQTVLALGMNSSAKFTACIGEA